MWYLLALEVRKELFLEVGHLKALRWEVILLTELHKSRLVETVNEAILLESVNIIQAGKNLSVGGASLSFVDRCGTLGSFGGAFGAFGHGFDLFLQV